MSDLTDEQIIRRMAEIEGLDTDGPITKSGTIWARPIGSDEGFVKYNPLDLSEAGRLIEKHHMWVDWNSTTRDWRASADGAHAIINVSLMHAITLAIIEAHGGRDEQ